jgi:hypothetical protein
MAKDVGLTSTQVSIITHSPSFAHELALRRSAIEAGTNQQIATDLNKVREAIREKTLAAVQRLGLVIDAGKDSDAVRACAEILDRGGVPRVQVTESKAVTVTLTGQDASRLIESLQMTDIDSSVRMPENSNAINS